MAYGSALEVETQIIIAKRLSLANEKDFTRIESLLDEILRMLNKITTNFRKEN